MIRSDIDLYYPYGPTYLSALAPVFGVGSFNQCAWGDEITQDVHWHGVNPPYLAESLAYTDIYITTGGGDTVTTVATDPIEQTCYFTSKWRTDVCRSSAAPPVGPFSYRSILPSFSVWGWTFATDHQVTEFTYLTAISPNGLVGKGSGTLQVTTASLYSPQSHWTVTQAESAPVVVTADRAGRLTFAVNLGPPHTAEQTGFETGHETAGWTQATVSIVRAK